MINEDIVIADVIGDRRYQFQIGRQTDHARHQGRVGTDTFGVIAVKMVGDRRQTTVAAGIDGMPAGLGRHQYFRSVRTSAVSETLSCAVA